MTIRTLTKTVVFEKPFLLPSIDRALPAGDYEVVSEEELLEGLSFPAYRRLQTYIHRRPTPDQKGLAPSYVVDPTDLDAALARDQAAADQDADGSHDNKMTRYPIETDMEYSDREAMNRASDDGMRVQSGW